MNMFTAGRLRVSCAHCQDLSFPIAAAAWSERKLGDLPAEQTQWHKLLLQNLRRVKKCKVNLVFEELRAFCAACPQQVWPPFAHGLFGKRQQRIGLPGRWVDGCDALSRERIEEDARFE